MCKIAGPLLVDTLNDPSYVGDTPTSTFPFEVLPSKVKIAPVGMDGILTFRRLLEVFVSKLNRGGFLRVERRLIVVSIALDKC